MDNNNNQETTEEQQKTELTPEQETKTIMPTMMDEESMEEQKEKLNLSAIIPEYNSEIASNTSLLSKETALKSDGSVVIGLIQNDAYTTVENAQLPTPINIKERTAEAIKNKNRKKKIDPNKVQKQNSRLQSYTALGALVVIIGLIGFYIYYKHIPKDSDFKPLNVVVELGTKLPIRVEDYVKPGIGNEVNEMAYTIDTSQVKIDEVGKYEFSVTHSGLTKKGTITIQDTTKPELEVKDVVIKKGSSYTPKSFVLSCYDLTGCNYSFEEEGTENKYTTGGKYNIYIVATDGYNNRTVKKANLIIEEIIKYYRKKYPYNRSNGYTLTEEYELHFDELLNVSIILSGIKTETYVYDDETVYQKAKDKYYGEINYTCDDENLTIIHSSAITSVGQGYTRYNDVLYYFLEAETGFEEYNKE